MRHRGQNPAIGTLVVACLQIAAIRIFIVERVVSSQSRVPRGADFERSRTVSARWLIGEKAMAELLDADDGLFGRL